MGQGNDILRNSFFSTGFAQVKEDANWGLGICGLRIADVRIIEIKIPATVWQGFFYLLMYAPIKLDVWPDATEKKMGQKGARHCQLYVFAN
jgi:hypothetical protein